MLAFVALIFSGLLAGLEVAICLGVRAPVANLDPPSHIRLRQALIRRLRIFVPVLFACALLTGGLATALDWAGAKTFWRLLGLNALLAFIALTLAGTVPINQAVLAWDPEHPPEGWQKKIARWETLDNWRTILAVLAFALFAWTSV